MNTERKERAEELFHKALELNETERAGYLAGACRHDPKLKGEVESLLAALESPSGLLQGIIESILDKPDKNETVDHSQYERSPDLPCRRLGDFKLIRKIGEGGMGIVYLAIQETLNREVAVKIIRPGHEQFLEAAARFWREIESLSKISHPNIAKVFHCGHENQIRYFAMELVEGKGLNEILIESRSYQNKMDLRLLLNWILEIAQALSSAHEAGIIHRDIKPSNIRITPEGSAKLMDFGIARSIDQSTLTRTGEFCGTPRYASPEQAGAFDLPLDERTDIYSLGVTFYEAIAGRVPFEGDTTEQILHQIRDIDPLPPQRLNPAVSRDQNTVILKAMEKEPWRRYQTMKEFAEDLIHLQNDEPINARPAGLALKISKRIRKNPALGVAIAAILALMVSLPLYAILITMKNAMLERQKEDLERLSDNIVAAQLIEIQDDLWPPSKEMLPEYDRWLVRLDELQERRFRHNEKRTEIETRGRKVANGNNGPDAIPLESQWVFDEISDAWQHRLLVEIVKNADRLSGKSKQNVTRRRNDVDRLEALMDLHVDEWDSAIQSIRSRMECPAYEGLELPVQSGLVPIGRNPSSGLWEFLHLQSHDQDEAIPRYGDEAECSTTDKTGLIFVLLPGGEYNIGDVSSIDDQALNDDPEFAPAQDETHHLKITLKPFFISKYEMTQGQWLRALYLNHDENPSSHGVGLKVGENTVTLKHPVENVSWIDCCHAVRCIGCKLPSEAEWEYAARGNTRSIWWSGNEPACLEGVDNILDRTALPFAQRGQVRSWVQEGLDDHFASHAPVGLFAANPFGLHDVHGNVAEWCQDVYENRYNEIIRDGSANENGKTKDRVSRGGHWISPLCKTRTSARRSSDPNDTTSFIGLRPARSVQ